MKTWALYLDYPNGTSLEVFATKEEAIESLYAFVCESWHEIEEDQNGEIVRPMPEDKNEAIELYFETKQEGLYDIETYELKECEIETKREPLTVVIDGGIVQAVVTHNPAQIGQPVTVVDYDTEGAEDSELSEVQQDDGLNVQAFVSQMTVEKSGIKTEFDA